MPDLDPADFDPETGAWLGTCDRCGTDHDGLPSDTLGGELACIRARTAALGPEGADLLARVDQARDRQQARTAEAVERYLNDSGGADGG